MTTAALSPNGTAVITNPTSAQKRKFSALDSEKVNGVSSQHGSPTPDVDSDANTDANTDVNTKPSDSLYQDLLVLLQRYVFTPYLPSSCSMITNREFHQTRYYAFNTQLFS
jgi:hypothetical protein